MSTELYLPPIKPRQPEPKGYNPKNGQFMKGHKSFNKGLRWDDFMPKRSQRNSRKGWKNLDIHRNKNGRPDTAGRCRKTCVAITDEGQLHVFAYLGAAAEWYRKTTGDTCRRENIGRCCRENHSQKQLKDTRGNFTTKTNTDHEYKGLRWYFESDYQIWKEKLR